MRISRTSALVVAGLALAGSALTVATASGADPSPQLAQPSGHSLAAAAPSTCTTLSQTTGGQRVRLLNNTPTTYTAAGWFNLKCGTTTFTVPRGSQALVSLGATAELDCNGTANGWCQGRFTVNGVPAKPDNTGRSDSYAWDSTNGGTYNWSAHQLTQALAVSCPRSTTTTTPCSYRVQLQGALTSGASSVWVDDTTVTVDVTYGAVKTSTVAVS